MTTADKKKYPRTAEQKKARNAKNKEKRASLTEEELEKVRAYARAYYRANPEKHLGVRLKTTKTMNKKKELIATYKSTHPCSCGESHPAALDFHHIDSAIKDGNISYMVRNNTLQELSEEISKCVVLCSNCHRKLHAGVLVLAA